MPIRARVASARNLFRKAQIFRISLRMPKQPHHLNRHSDIEWVFLRPTNKLKVHDDYKMYQPKNFIQADNPTKLVFKPLIATPAKKLPDSINGNAERAETIGNLMDNIQAASTTLRKQKQDAQAKAAAVQVVSRKISVANAAASESGRPPSPTIIWRESNHVQLATDLPPNLYKSLCNVGKIPKAPTSASRKGFQGPRKATQTKKNRIRYGAWYMPTNKWEVKGRSDDNATCVLAEKQVGESNQHYKTKKESKVAGLFIGKEYRKFVENSGGELPHYLRN